MRLLRLLRAGASLWVAAFLSVLTGSGSFSLRGHSAALAAQGDGCGVLRHLAHLRHWQGSQREREAVHFGPVLTGDGISAKGHQAVLVSLHGGPLRVRREDVGRFGYVGGLCLCHTQIRTEALRFVKQAENGLFSWSVACAC